MEEAFEEELEGKFKFEPPFVGFDEKSTETEKKGKTVKNKNHLQDFIEEEGITKMF